MTKDRCQFLQYLLYCDDCRTSEEKAVTPLSSTYIKVYVCISPVDLHSFDCFFLRKWSLWSAAFALSAPTLWIHQPEISDYQHNQSRPTFCPPFFTSITLIAVWPASSSEFCHPTYEHIYCIWGFFQFKMSFSLATSIIPVLCSVPYRTIQWDFLTQAGIGHMSWQTKSDSVQPSAKLSGRYPKTNYQLSLNLNLGEIIAIFWMEAGLMAHQRKWGPETETRNKQDGECENTFMFPNTNESLHQTHNANLYSMTKPK